MHFKINMEPLSSFAISFAAGIAFDLWSKSQGTVEKEIKKSFNDALCDWCTNDLIRNAEELELKKDFEKRINKTADNSSYICPTKFQKFYEFFEKRLSQNQVAFNYVSSIRDVERYNHEICILNSVKSDTTQIEKKVTDILNILEKKPKTIKQRTQPISVRRVLFNNYSKESEDYYISRKIDDVVLNFLKTGNMWIYGMSGIGKTAIINRNLIQNNIEFIYCDFSPIEITCSDSVIEEINLSITEKYGLLPIKKTDNKIKNACELLTQIESKDIVIVVDEISIDDNLLLKKVTDSIVKLITHYCNTANSTSLRFIISTINKPCFEKSQKNKANEHFEFLEIDSWDDDLERLLILILQSLDCEIDQFCISVIISNSCNSPRLLKKIVRKIYTLKKFDLESVTLISETLRKEHF